MIYKILFPPPSPSINSFQQRVRRFGAVITKRTISILPCSSVIAIVFLISQLRPGESIKVEILLQKCDYCGTTSTKSFIDTCLNSTVEGNSSTKR